jgi:uncharacterized integral membrane protein
LWLFLISFTSLLIFVFHHIATTSRTKLKGWFATSEEEPEVSDTNDQDEEEYAPTDEAEANISEEEGVSRGGRKKKEDEVGSDEEHEFDDAIGTMYFVWLYLCLIVCLILFLLIALIFILFNTSQRYR